MRRRRTSLRGVAAALALCVAAAPAAAQEEPDRPNAKAAGFERKGKKAYAKKRWDDAIAAFELAYQADPLPRFLFNAGRAFEQKGDLVRAIGLVERYVREETDDEERADGEQVLQILKAKLSRSHAQVRVRSVPPGARVLVEGEGRKVTGTAPWTAWLPVGAFKVLVSKEGHEPWRGEVIAQAGAPLDVVAKLEAVGAAARKGPARLRLRGGEAEKGARATIDGEEKGPVPLELELPAGRHLLQVEQEGYRKWERWVELAEAETRTIELALVKEEEKPAAGQTTGFGGAALGLAPGGPRGGVGSVGGAPAGGAAAPGTGPRGTGVSGLSLGAGGRGPTAGGEDGWGEEPEERREQPGTPRGALLSVSCNVVGAEVVLDGNVLGTAPLTDVEIPPTPQTLVVRREGHEDFLRAIIPRAGERLTLEAVLKPKAGEYAAGRTFFKLLAGVHGVAHVEHTGEYRELGGTLDAAATQTMEGTRLGAALQFGSMTNPYFGMGAILGFWFADSDYGLAVSRTAEFSPFLELRLPIRAAGRELVELYANAGGGLSVRFLHDDVVEALELAGTKTDPFGIGWNVVTALGGQVNVTRTLGLFVEAGWQMRRFTHTLNRYGGEGVRDGSRDVGWNELALGVGLAHLH